MVEPKRAKFPHGSLWGLDLDLSMTVDTIELDDLHLCAKLAQCHKSR